MTTAEEYVAKYGKYFLAITQADLNNLQPDEARKLYADMLEAINHIKSGIVTDLENSWNANGQLFGRAFNNMVVDHNRVWNRVDELLTELTGCSWLESDVFLNLWLKVLNDEEF